MADVLALALYAPLLAVAVVAVWRRPLVALYAFVVGLALHNLAMALLYGAGVRGGSLTVVAAWKEILLATALARVGADALRTRALPFRPHHVDVLALAFAAVVLVYAVIPQDVLGGEADANAILLALRHDLAGAAAYFLGRAVVPGAVELRRIAWTIVAAAAAVASFGIVDAYAVSLDAWRGSGAVGYFRDQLDLEYEGLSGLPENFVYNTGDEDELVRRLVATFLSPLASAYMFAVALLVAPLRRAAVPLAVVIAAALLLTFSRAALLALAGALVVLALGRRRAWPAAAAVGVVALGIVWANVFPRVAPETSFTSAELAVQRENARENPGAEGDPLSTSEPSVRSHLTNLRAGAERVATHPQGYGLGNAGHVAARQDVRPRAGESNYTEIGVETGIAGLLLFVGWNLALLVALVRAARRTGEAVVAGVAAALAAVLAIAIQTDAFGIPWLAYCLWWLGGALVLRVTRRVSDDAASNAPQRVPTAARPSVSDGRAGGASTS